MHAKNWTLIICVLVVCFWTVISIGVSRNKQPELSQPVFSEQIQNPVEEFQLERDQLRTMQKAQLNDIIHGENTEPEIVALAQRQLMDLLKREEAELSIEGMLSMRGFDEPVAAVRSNSANIFIQTEIITKQQSVMIMDLVSRETGIQSGNIKIIPVN